MKSRLRCSLVGLVNFLVERYAFPVELRVGLVVSVSTVFSENLKQLIDGRMSISKAAEAVDVSRIQFSRYLRGEAFPRPAELARICTFFDVDARILLEPLKAVAAHRVEEGAMHLLAQALERASQNAETFFQDDELPGGLYELWRRSMADETKFVRLPLQIQANGPSRKVRGYDPAKLYSGSRTETLVQRRFDGVVFRQAETGNYVVLFFHNAPSLVISFGFFAPDVYSASGDRQGFVVLSRAASPRRRRMSNCLLRKVEVTPRKIIDFAHAPAWLDEDQVPEDVLGHINRDVDG